jgi:hypothetical protein
MCRAWLSGAENQSEDGFAIWTVFVLLSTHGCFDLLSLLYGASRAQATWVLRDCFNPRFPNAREPALAAAGFLFLQEKGKNDPNH